MLRVSRFLSAILIAALFCAAVPSPASAQVSFGIGFAVNIGPPALPYYSQPPCPTPNYVWMPGFWAWGQAGYYWVPGTWVAAADPGYYWTPGYWSNNGSSYGWNPGYWGTQVGYYGGINYGYGYYGNGYAGGRWQGNQFQYNTAISNVNTNYVRNVYVNQSAYSNAYASPQNRIAYNGGRGGVQAQPTARQRSYSSQSHVALTPMQNAHIQAASSDRNMYSSVNRGRPAQVAVARPYTSNSRPANYAPIQTQDRGAAQSHVVAHQPANASGKSVNSTQQHAMAPQHAAQPQQHAQAPQQQHAAQPQQHAQAPQQQHAQAPQQQHAAQPQQHAQAPQQQHAQAPQQQHAQAPQQQHAQAPQQHAAQPQQHSGQAPPQHP